MALAGEPITDVFTGKGVDVKLPVLITAQMLLGFRHPEGMCLWEYLDAIWSAFEVGTRETASGAFPEMLSRLRL